MPNLNETGRPRVWLSQENWDLHRKAPQDSARHDQKVRDAIRDNLGDIISREDIVTSSPDGKGVVRIPVPILDLPHFRHGENRGGNVGQGQGDSQVGDVVGQAPGDAGPGKGKGAGDQPGVDYIDASVDIDDLAAFVFEDLELPFMKPKNRAEIEAKVVRFNDIRKTGPMATWDKRRSMKANLIRNARAGDPRIGGWTRDDMRFKTWTEDLRFENNAAVIAMRDVSGSMGEFEKYISRSFYFWMLKFLRTKYTKVDLVFITHHTEAKEVDEETFFSLGESGGTKVSSAYRLALDVMRERYSPQDWNVYPFHFSDGDNWGETDNRVCLELVKRMIEEGANAFGYGEIRQEGHGSLSTLMSAYKGIQDPRFIPVTITDRSGVHTALKSFFHKRDGEGGERRV